MVEVAQTLEKAPNGMAVLEEPQGSFQEMSKFVFCYNPVSYTHLDVYKRQDLYRYEF